MIDAAPVDEQHPSHHGYAHRVTGVSTRPRDEPADTGAHFYEVYERLKAAMSRSAPSSRSLWRADGSLG